MAGYIMTLNLKDDPSALTRCILTGSYSTTLPNPRVQKDGSLFWGASQEGTFADYFSMKAGDHIYFFCKRILYGTGLIINIGSDCKYLNYLGSDFPNTVNHDDFECASPLLPESTPSNRCFCTFKPSPAFFKGGVDMDDVLNSNPGKFKMLRAMWKVSFIKIDEEEDSALADIILKRNEDSIGFPDNAFEFSNTFHGLLAASITRQYELKPDAIVKSCAKGNLLKHEMAIEASLCHTLGSENDTPFGHWDYISHQVVASPFKAIDYMDKMDLFGYKYIPGFSTISKYLIIEIKKDTANVSALEQLMKYVDWVSQEYTHGDFSMIEAYLVAYDFPTALFEARQTHCIRNFTKGYRPSLACVWSFVRFIRYRYISDELVYELID